MKRENVVGRANVEDTPELEAYYRELEGEALGALWNVANAGARSGALPRGCSIPACR